MARSAKHEGSPAYALEGKPKIERVLIAILLCGLVACISVAIIGALLLFMFNAVGTATSAIDTNQGFLSGFMFALIASAFNWVVFYISIPAAWLALGLSIGHMPRRGITRRAPYFRWGAIWGAILVAGTTAIFSGLIMNNLRAGLGGLVGGSITGMLAGLICAWLFLAIVRPAEQIGRSRVEVF